MRAAVSTLEVARPRNLGHALALLHDSMAGERLVPLAGGTDLFVSLNAGVVPGRRFLDLSGLRELTGVRPRDGALVLGALTTFREIREHPVVARRYPALAAAASEIGAWQIQNRATLGGNIANGSPAGDSLPVLLALEAAVEVGSVRGTREVAFTELFRGYRDLALEPDELIVRVSLPDPDLPAGRSLAGTARATPARARAGAGHGGPRIPRTTQFFRKVGSRRAQTISKVVLCALHRVGPDGRAEVARVALGSVAPVPLRARRTEQALLGAKPSRAVAAAARTALLEDIAPIDDIRSDRDYRLRVSCNLLEQSLRVAHPGYVRG
jgi:CO/xanthine dehydrogenase FAD-binding subunit